MKYAGYLLFPHITDKEAEVTEIRRLVNDKSRNLSFVLTECKYCAETNRKCLNAGCTKLVALWRDTFLWRDISLWSFEPC